MMLSATAQKWDGFFVPVTTDKVYKGIKGEASGTWLFRPTVAVTATTFKMNIVDGKFSGFRSAFLSKAGVGLSYAHYIEVEGLPYNNFSVNGIVLLPTANALGVVVEDNSSLALAVTVTALRYVNIGLGYDIIKGVPVTQNLFLLTGVTLTF